MIYHDCNDDILKPIKEINDMRLLVSCVDSGSLKEIVCNVGTDTSIQTELQPLHLETSLSQGLKSSIEKISVVYKDQIILARSNGVLDMATINKIPSKAKEQDGATDEEVKPLPQFEISKFELVDSVSDLLNDLRLEPFYNQSKRRVKLKDGFVALQPLHDRKDIYLAVTKSGLVHIIKIDRKQQRLVKIKTLEVRPPVDFAQLYDLNYDEEDSKYIFGYGGEENLVKLVELERDFSKLTQIWEAKNVKNDKLDLRVPVWPTAMKFLSPYKSQDIDKSKINLQFVTISHWSHLGLYRTQHGRKPLEYKELLPNREPLTQLELVGEDVTSIGNINKSEFKDFSFITTDTKHNVFKFETSGRLLAKFGKNDITGAATFVGVAKHQYLLQGGLDRYSRVYDLKSGHRIAKVYVGNAVNYVLMLDNEEVLIPNGDNTKDKKESKKRKLAPEEQEIQNDDLWHQLEQPKGYITKKQKN